MALATFSAFSRESDPSDPNSEINKALFRASVIYSLAKRLNPSLLPFITQMVSRWGLTEELEELTEHDPWAEKDLAEIWMSLQEQELWGQPFSDASIRREVSFAALGITWRFHWDNTYEMTAVAEQFLAALQIILADLAGIDLCLLRTSMDVEVLSGRGADPEIREFVLNQSKWRLTLPLFTQAEGVNQNLVAGVVSTASTLLLSASLLPSQKLLDVLEDAFREGLSTKVFSVERYELLYHEFTSKEILESFERQPELASDSRPSLSPVVHSLLGWKEGPGPGYSKERAEEGLRRRYEKLPRLIQHETV